MANKTISQLTDASTPLTGDELFHVEQEGNSRKVPVDDIRGPNLKSIADLTLVEGDLLYVNGDEELVRLPKGTAGQVLYQNAGATAPEWGAGPVLTKYYESSALAVSLGGTNTVSHGLGVEPKITRIIAVCTTADGVYAVGERIDLASTMIPLSSGAGAQVEFDATEINVRFGGAGLFGIRSGGGFVYANAARWQIIVQAWA